MLVCVLVYKSMFSCTFLKPSVNPGAGACVIEVHDTLAVMFILTGGWQEKEVIIISSSFFTISL